MFEAGFFMEASQNKLRKLEQDQLRDFIINMCTATFDFLTAIQNTLYIFFAGSTTSRRGAESAFVA